MIKLLLLPAILAVPPVIAQSIQPATGSIKGTVIDLKTNKPVPVAFVSARRDGLPAFSKSSKSDAVGAFQLRDLIAGTYTICVQAVDNQYLDPCRFKGTPVAVTLAAAQVVTGLAIKVTPASVLAIHVQDPTDTIANMAKASRRPNLSLGVWGPDKLYYTIRGNPSSNIGPGLSNAGTSYIYRLAIPRDTPLTLHIASPDLRLGDGAGVTLGAASAQFGFSHATGDANPTSFKFTVLGPQQ